MKRNAQISIFLIIGVILVVFSLFIISLNSDNKISVLGGDNSVDLNTEKIQVDDIINACLEQSYINAFYYLGTKGMLSLDEKSSLIFNNNSNDYLTFYYDDKKQIPDLDLIEESLEKEISKNFLSCFNHTIVGYDFEFEFDEKDIRTEVKIQSNQIRINLNLPISITDFNYEKFYMDEFTYISKYNFIEKYNLVSDFVDFEIQNLNLFNIGNLINYAKENNFSYEFEYVSSDIIKFTFIFTDFVKEKPFKYSFLIKYYWGIENE